MPNIRGFRLTCRVFEPYLIKKGGKMGRTLEQPRIWYPARSAGGGLTKILDDAEAHILWKGIFLCRKTVNQVINETKAEKGVVRVGVIPGNPMCAKCQETYKASPEFPYYKWVELVKGE
jgi:hypothetical protein